MPLRWLPAGVLVAVFLAAHVYAAVIQNGALGELLLDLTFLPIAVASFLYGLRGAVAGGLVAA